MDSDQAMDSNPRMALLFPALAPAADHNPQDRHGSITAQIRHDIDKTIQEIRGVEAPAEGGEANRGTDEPAPVAPTEAIDNNRMQGYNISYGAPTTPPRVYRPKIRLKARLLSRIIRIEFDPDNLRATTLDKALMADIPLPDDIRNGNQDYYHYCLTREYERILNRAEYITRRRTALQAFEDEMDVSTAVCLAKAAKLDPQYAAVRRRLRQMDERYKVKGDQSLQFGELMGFLRGATDSNVIPTHPQLAEGNNGEGDNNAIRGSQGQDQGTAGEDDEGEGAGWDNGLPEGGDE